MVWFLPKTLMFYITEVCSGSLKGEEEDDEDGFDWQVEQQVDMETLKEQLNKLQKYGFGNQRSGVFTGLQVRSLACMNNVYVTK